MTRRRGPRPLALVAFAAAVAAVPWLVAHHRASPSIAATPIEARLDDAPARAAEDPLVGLWSAHEPGVAGTPVRFYYFHGDGHGLYRYGRVGATNTNSFDYELHGDELELRFRKTGARHRVRIALEQGEHVRTLVLEHDPRAGGRQRYAQARATPVEHGVAAAGVPGRMWIDHRRFDTGGEGFALYQLRGAGIDGRGTGWFHRGDFDDWTTESLTYRIAGDAIELEFAAGDRHTTTFTYQPGEPAVLELREDPRDFWHPHRFRDGGPSFGMLTPTRTAALDAAPAR